VITAPTTADILESITRVTLMQLFQEEMRLTVKEQEIDRTQVYVADEAFFCGSGYEVTPILSVDRFPVGNGQPGPITQEILQHYLRVVRGTTDKHAEWRTPIYQRVLATA
jgi:branched-chain amino acid aminotransferase